VLEGDPPGFAPRPIKANRVSLFLCRLSEEKEYDSPCIISVGIIDILIEYEGTKHAEHALKSIVYDGAKISVVPPNEYGPRFRKFLHDGIELPPKKVGE